LGLIEFDLVALQDSKEFTKHVVAAPNAFLINLVRCFVCSEILALTTLHSQGNSNHDSQ
jgi:hypothetical protein